MTQPPIELKGSSFTLSVVHLHHSQPDVIRQALQDKIDQAPAFLKNAPVVLNISSLTEKVNWIKIKQAVHATGLRIVGVCGCKDEDLKRIIARAGLPLLAEGREQSKKAEAKTVSVSEPDSSRNKSRVITTPIRSGQQIYARNADLVIINSVGAGAELVADGNIHIYGMMRGRALAGAGGDSDSQIFCTSLSAELVSIAGEYWMMDQIPPQFSGQAARLNLMEGGLTINFLT